MGRANGGKPTTKAKTKKKTATVARKIAPASLPDFTPPIDVTPKETQEEKERKGGYTMTDDNLSDSHIHFCRRFAVHSNGSRASREAGFNEHYYNWGLKQQPILNRIEQFRKKRRQKFELSADRVIAELVRIAFGNLDDFLEVAKDGTPVIDCGDVGREEMAALQSIEQDVYYEKTVNDDGDTVGIPVKRTKIKLYDKLRALEMLGRNLNLWSPEELDNLSSEEKAAKIVAALRAMSKADGETV